MDIKHIRKDFPVYDKHPDLIYFDSAASALKVKAAIDEGMRYYTDLGVNAHRGAYHLAYETTELYEASRRDVASFIGAHPEEIIFTRGTTMSLNMIARALEHTIQPGDEIITSELEHHSSLLPWMEIAKRRQASLVYVPLTSEGRITVSAFEQVLSDRTAIVALTHVSNVMGYMTPIKEITRRAKTKNAIVILDAAQSVPHMPVDVRDLDVDFLAFSGHKMFAPTGIGVLYGKKTQLEALSPVEFGGEMADEVFKDHATYKALPLKFEAGTPNIAGVIGLAAAIRYINALSLKTIHDHTERLHQYLLTHMKQIEGLTIYNDTAENPVITFNIDGIHPHDASTMLDQFKIGVRSGHHCAHLVSRFLGVNSTIRASMHVYNTLEDCDALISGIIKTRDFFNQF
jgi:cysteine desulfurase / selenocysteine lyase